MNAPKAVETRRKGHVLTVTLNRPHLHNSLDAAACFELSAVWDAFQNDDDLWVAIVTGADDRAFCAGHDLGDDFFAPMPETGWAGMSERTDLTKPIIAAVNGIAYGGGFEIALACDIVIADERARFAMSEPRVGYVAGGGGADRLCLRMPAAIAMGMLLTGKPMAAAEAHRWGLVNEVAAPGTALDVAQRWADDILECSPHAVRHTKALALEALEWRDMRQHLAERRREVFHSLHALEDTHEGIRAFAEKRKPVWKGR